MEKNYHYNKKTKHLARSNRKAGTKAEIRLWCELLRNGQMRGYQFLRQRSVLNYIADFMCKELKLIIEVDGITHQFKEVGERDKMKQMDIENAGFTVLRFTDWEIHNDLAEVDVIMTKWIMNYEEKHPDVLKMKKKSRMEDTEK